MADRIEHASDSERPERASVGLPFVAREPVAKRLNRNALTVAAVIMGVTVLTAVVLLNPERSSPPDAGTPLAQAPPAEHPAFLNQPLRASPMAVDTSPHTADRDAGRTAGMTRMPGGHERRGTGGNWDHRMVSSDGGASRVAARARAFQAALTSGIVVGDGPRAMGQSDAAAWDAVPGGNGSQLTGQRIARFGDAMADQALGMTAAGQSGAVGGPMASYAARTGVPPSRHGVSTIARVMPAGSRYTLRAGTVIPGVLLTGITSDLPGEIIGQVSRDVYDSRTERVLLIPKGAKLIGTYDNRVVASQSRLLIAWTRLLFPDGRSLVLPGLAGTDAAGQAGLKDKVDNHTRHVFGSALLLSLLSAGVQLSQPRSASIFAAPSAGQVAAGALGQQMSEVALERLRRGLDVPPTITIRAGQPFNVVLNGDLVFDGPYEVVP